jgi:hypothetical protein
VLDQMERRFQGIEENYGLRMRLLLAAGRSQEASAIYDRCQKLNSTPIVAGCRKVWEEKDRPPAGGAKGPPGI